MLRKKVYIIRRIALLLVAVLLVIAATGCALQGTRQELPDNIEDPEEILAPYKNGYAVIDQASEDFELLDLEGNLVKLSDLKGKIVFLNFWATWCPPCRDEMPHMQTFYERYKDQDVEILAVAPTSVENRGTGNSDKAERQVRAFIEEYGFTFPVLLDKEDEAWAVYQQRGIPANYVIDAKGIVRYLKPGSFLSVEEMEAFLEAVLATEAE